MTISILLVDDEEADIIRFKRAARKAGVQRRIDVRKNAPDALALLASQGDPSLAEAAYLLVSDLKMPIMLGTELVARIRGELGLAGLSAFILSSSDATADADDALSSGANGYIVKCESDTEFLSVVEWLDGCCRRIDHGQGLTDGTDCEAGRPHHVLAGPVPYSFDTDPIAEKGLLGS